MFNLDNWSQDCYNSNATGYNGAVQFGENQFNIEQSGLNHVQNFGWNQNNARQFGWNQHEVKHFGLNQNNARQFGWNQHFDNLGVPTIYTICPTTGKVWPITYTTCQTTGKTLPTTSTVCHKTGRIISTTWVQHQTQQEQTGQNFPTTWTWTTWPVATQNATMPTTFTVCPTTGKQLPVTWTTCPTTGSALPTTFTVCPTTGKQLPVTWTTCPTTGKILPTTWTVGSRYNNFGAHVNTLNMFDTFDQFDHMLARNMQWLHKPTFMPTIPLLPTVPDKYRVIVDITGYKTEFIKTEFVGGNLVVAYNEEQKHTEGDYQVKQFKKTFKLPQNVQVDKMASFVADSFLVVEIPILVPRTGQVGEDLLPQIVDHADGQKLVKLSTQLPAGVEQNKIKITCKDRDVIIRAEDPTSTTKYDTISRAYFYKRCTLPENTDFNALKCLFENGKIFIEAPVYQLGSVRHSTTSQAGHYHHLHQHDLHTSKIQQLTKAVTSLGV